MHSSIIRYLAMLSVLVLSASAMSAELPRASGRALLTISGQIEHSNERAAHEPVAMFDRELLAGLGATVVETSTDWTDGVKRFEGPLVRDVLDRVGASGSVVMAIAINDYEVEISTSDFQRYPVILAMTMNDKPLSRRDKGPLWIVYPRDDHPELATPEVNARWVWQLKALTVR